LVNKKNGGNKKGGGKKPTAAPVGPVDRTGDCAPCREEGANKQNQSADYVSEGAIVRLTRALVWWTGLLAVATTGLGIAAFFQWRALESTDHHIAEQLQVMRAGQRAWVTIETVEIDGPLSLSLDRDTAAVQLKIGLRNIGTIPAVRVWSALHLYPDDLFKSFPPECQATTRSLLVGINLLPNEFNDSGFWQAHTEAGGIYTPIPKEDDFGLVVVGCVLYESFGDKTVRTTGFAGSLFRKNKKNFTREKTSYEANELIFSFFQGMGSEIR
jgi:hypothetical protein